MNISTVTVSPSGSSAPGPLLSCPPLRPNHVLEIVPSSFSIARLLGSISVPTSVEVSYADCAVVTATAAMNIAPVPVEIGHGGGTHAAFSVVANDIAPVSTPV